MYKFSTRNCYNVQQILFNFIVGLNNKSMQGVILIIKMVHSDLVYFTTRMSDTSNASTTQATQAQHECDTSNMRTTWVSQERHDWNDGGKF